MANAEPTIIGTNLLVPVVSAGHSIALIKHGLF